MTTTELVPDVRAQLELTIEHFNANHADTVLFMAQFAADRPDADDAEILDVDTSGVDLRVAAAGVAGMVRIGFDVPVSSVADVRRSVLATIEGARSAAGDTHPMTSLEREFVTNPRLPTMVSTVVEVRTLSPNLREVVLEGGFETFHSSGGDQFVYLMVPRLGGPAIADDHTMAAQQAADPDTAHHAAY